MNKLAAGMFLTGFTFIFAGIVTLMVISSGSRAAAAYAEEIPKPATPQMPVLRLIRGADLAFSVSGKLVDLPVNVGDRVVAGQVIARLDDRQQRAEVVKAKASVARSEAAMAILQLRSMIITQEESSSVGPLEKAQMFQSRMTNSWNLRVAEAAAEFAIGVTEYRRVFMNFLGLYLTDDQARHEPQELLAILGIDLTVLFDSELRPVNAGELIFSTPGVGVPLAPTDNPSTSWNDALVYGWLNYFDGEILTSFEDVSVPEGGINIGKQMNDAWIFWEVARETLDAVVAEQELEMADLEAMMAALLLAQTELAVNLANLDLAQIALTNTKVVAPFNGIVVNISSGIMVEGWVEAGTAVGRLEQDAGLEKTESTNSLSMVE